MDKISITLVIADRQYKLNVKRDEEALYREATEIINDGIKSYAKFAHQDRQDLLAMVALQHAANALKNERIQSFRDNKMIEKLLEIDNLLDNLS